jgi:hypothetical protein
VALHYRELHTGRFAKILQWQYAGSEKEQMALLIPGPVRFHVHQCRQCGCIYNCGKTHQKEPFFSGVCNQCDGFQFRKTEQ